MMKLNEFQKYEATLLIPYEKYFELIYETKYLLEARLGSNRIFIARKSFYGCNRRMAVVKANDWYGKHLKKVLGHALNTMFIDDPLNEVTYDEGFVCTDLRNKYLDDQTIKKLLEDAQGDLGREDSITKDRVASGSVKRLRKRRKREVKLTERLSQTAGGTIYYKMAGQRVGKGNRLKVTKVKLTSKSLNKARQEVVRRGLDKFESFSNCKSLAAEKVNSENKAA